jgi:hypothetical protein
MAAARSERADTHIAVQYGPTLQVNSDLSLF